MKEEEEKNPPDYAPVHNGNNNGRSIDPNCAAGKNIKKYPIGSIPEFRLCHFVSIPTFMTYIFYGFSLLSLLFPNRHGREREAESCCPYVLCRFLMLSSVERGAPPNTRRSTLDDLAAPTYREKIPQFVLRIRAAAPALSSQCSSTTFLFSFFL